MASHEFPTLIDTRPATAAQLAPLAFAGHAHFTAMQVRDGRVRGLDLHLARLRQASRRLYGQTLPDEQVRLAMRAALKAGPADMSLLVTVYSTGGEFVPATPDERLALLVRGSPAFDGPAGPLRLASFNHERTLPDIKHVGEIAKTSLLREAVARGADDAVFIDREGRISEGSIWNLAFWDGTTVVWPRAAMLVGTTQGIVQRQLARMGVPQREQALRVDDLRDLTGAVVMNSWTPGVAVAAIDDIALPSAPDFVALLHRAYQGKPTEAP